MDIKNGNDRKFTKLMETQVEKFYFDLYVDRWSQPEVAFMMARVPSIAMWDDHDIFDGWGSYPDERQNCDVFQGIRKWAAKAFRVFQQHLGDEENRATAIGPQFGFSFGHVIGNVAFLAVDMRTERTSDQVLSIPHWDQIYQWLDAIPPTRHLFILSSIPVVYPGFDTLESLLGALPGYQDLEDDLRDHWNSPPHKAERLRLVHRLFDFARAKRIRPTVLSGDVHVAAVGVIENDRVRESVPVVINQLISSGIVHPGPPAAVLFCLKHLFDSDTRSIA
jgi:phosphodiesterase/alkaline phosphatase D-like protein